MGKLINLRVDPNMQQADVHGWMAARALKVRLSNDSASADALITDHAARALDSPSRSILFVVPLVQPLEICAQLAAKENIVPVPVWRFVPSVS